MLRLLISCAFVFSLCCGKSIWDENQAEELHTPIGALVDKSWSTVVREMNMSCTSVCVHRQHSAVGCDFYRLLERMPHLHSCFTGQARLCSRKYVSYCWNKEVARLYDIAQPRCDAEGFTCGDTTISREDLSAMDCKCSIKCDETCQ